MFALVELTDEVRGIVVNVPLPLPLFVPIHPTPLYDISNCCENEKLKDFVPSALWAIVVEPLARVLVVLVLIPTVFVPL